MSPKVGGNVFTKEALRELHDLQDYLESMDIEVPTEADVFDIEDAHGCVTLTLSLTLSLTRILP
jgi:hypothetical protein